MGRCGGEGPPAVGQGTAHAGAMGERAFTPLDPAAAMSIPAEAGQSVAPPDALSQSVAPLMDAYIPGGPAAGSFTPPYSPEVLAVARRYQIPIGRVQVVLSDPSVKALEGQIARGIEQRLTPENLARWLASPKGEAWMKQNPEAFAETVRQRARMTGVGVGVGVLGLLGAEQVADIIGLDPVHHTEERFFFIIMSMHGAERLGSTAWSIAPGRLQGRPFDFMRHTLVRQGGQTMVQVTFEARSSFSRALAAALTANFAVEGSVLRTVANGAKGVLLLPVRMIPSMGPGIAAARLADAALGDALPPDSKARWWISTLAFFLPGAYVTFTRGWGVAFLRRIGFGLVGRAFAVGFGLDIGAMLLQRIVMGDEAAYQRSVSQRVAKRYFDDQMMRQVRAIDDMPWYASIPVGILWGLQYNVREGTNFVAPVAMAEARRGDADVSYENNVYAEDARASREIQATLPRQLFMLLAQGIGAERDTARFYQTVDVGVFRDEIELDGAAEKIKDAITSLAEDRSLSDGTKEELLRSAFDSVRSGPGGEEALNRALALIQAHGIQRSLSTLHFIHLPVNGRIREIVDVKGVVQEGKEDALLGLLDPKQSPAQVREALLALRRAALIVRILDADEAKRPALVALAQEVGLADAQGNLIRSDLYYQAASEWSKMAAGDPARKARLDAHRDGLVLQMQAAAGDPARQLELAKEVMVLSGAAAGINIAVDQEPVVAEAALPADPQAVVTALPVGPKVVWPGGDAYFSGLEIVPGAPAPAEADAAGADAAVFPWEADVCEDPATTKWSTPAQPLWTPPPVFMQGGAAVYAH